MKSIIINAVAAAAVVALLGTQTVAAQKGNQASCRAKASAEVGGDTQRQAKRYAAVYRNCMSGGK